MTSKPVADAVVSPIPPEIDDHLARQRQVRRLRRRRTRTARSCATSGTSTATATTRSTRATCRRSSACSARPGTRQVGLHVTDDSGAVDDVVRHRRRREPPARRASSRRSPGPPSSGHRRRSPPRRQLRPRRRDRRLRVGFRRRRRLRAARRVADRRATSSPRPGPIRWACASPTTAARPTSSTSRSVVVATQAPVAVHRRHAADHAPGHAGDVRSDRVAGPRPRRRDRQLRLGLRR